MKRFVLLILAVVTVPASFAVQKLYQSGRIVSVEQKARTRVLYYLVNTPVTQDDPYYEIKVQLQDTIYLTEFTPRHADDTPPDDWTPDAAVQGRIDRRHLFLRRPSGAEIDLVVVRHSVAEAATTTQEGAPPKK